MAKPKQGWYVLKNPDKFVKPLDKFMGSFNESTQSVQYKSSLEAKAFRYCDYNPNIIKWSCEPLHIKYLKPVTGKVHRYFIDLYIEFKDNLRFLVEIKHSSEVNPPKIPTKKTPKNMARYQKAMQTFSTNQAKWKAAEEFCKARGMRFIKLTEEVLK